MKKLLIMNYIYAVLLSIGVVKSIIEVTLYNHEFIGSGVIPLVFIIASSVLVIVFLKTKNRVAKGAVMFSNITSLAFILFSIYVVMTTITNSIFYILVSLFFVLPYLVNIFMLHRDRYRN